jgi:hypothetical protein
MPRGVTCHYTQLSNTHRIPLYETDTAEDIQKRASGTVAYPPLLFFPSSSFSIRDFVENSAKFPLLDLGQLLVDIPMASIPQLPNLYKAVQDYKIPLSSFLEDWVFLQLLVHFKDNMAVLAPHLLLVKSVLTLEWFQQLEFPLVDPDTQKRLHRRQFLDRLSVEWYTTKRQTFLDKTKQIESHNVLSQNMGTLFQATSPLSLTGLEYMGKVILLDIPTTTDSTGTIFNQLVLHDELCVAKYKNFYKMYTPRRLDVSGFEEKVPDFYSTSVYSADGKLLLLIQNTEKGLRLQCILSQNSFLSSLENLLNFLPIPTPTEYEEISAGLLAEFFVDNPSPLDAGVPWSAFQAPLLANLVMNEDAFSKFLSVNDTDKISRQNHSLYLYFFDPLPVPSPHTIYVSGWNRLASRFGDLTAILTPVQLEKGDFKIHVKITRSSHQEVLDKFMYILSRLIRLYNEQYLQQLEMFQALVPGYTPVLQEPMGNPPTLHTLSTLDPILFPSNVYSRSCQNPHPVVISNEAAAKLPEDRKLLFPPLESNGVPPRWFTCPTTPYEKDQKVYAYPGLKKLPRIDHPFHAAPCCYIKPHTDKSKKVVENILHPPEEKPEKVVYMPNLRPLETQKIINHVGQRGRLPEPIEHFMTVLQPFVPYYRVGVPTHWEQEPILAALEYYYALREKQSFFRSPRVLRTLLLKEPLQITLQQNYDIGLQGVARILRENEYMDPTRFYKLLENFYRVNLFVLTRDKDQKIHILQPRFISSYYWNKVPSRPAVFVYQHYGGSADSTDEDIQAQCELIGYEKSGVLRFDMDADPKFFHLVQLAMATFQGNQLNTPLVLPFRQEMIKALDAQILDGMGKTRALLFTEARYMGVLITPMAPLLLESVSKNWLLPVRADVEAFLEHCKVPVLHRQEYAQQYVFLHVDLFTPMVFVVKYAPGGHLETLVSEPSFLQYILPEKESVISQMTWTQRFATILQDYLVILLAEYMDLHKDILTTKSIPEIVDSFLQEKTRYDSGYTLPMESSVSPLVRQNPQLLIDDRLVLPLSFQPKMPFFLRWWMTMKSDDIRFLGKFRELPSYFEYAEDFQRVPFHMIQNTLTNLTDFSSHSSYLSTPLAYLHYPFFKHDLQTDKVYYYFNASETPLESPYILLVAKEKDPLLKAGQQYLVEHQKLEIKGKKCLENYWFCTDKTKKWVRHGDNPPQMALFHSTESSQYYGLFPFSS